MVAIAQDICYQQAAARHIPQIVTLHETYISLDPLHEFQDLYLKYYYQKILETGDTVMIALAGEQVIGFCTLVSNQRGILLDLMKQKYREILKFPVRTWGPIAGYLVSKIIHEVFGRKWGNRELAQYRDCPELRAIATDPEYRRARVGSQMLQACIHWARQAHKLPMIAWVNENNDKSIGLFQSNGFQKVGVRQDKTDRVFLFLLQT